MVATVGVVELSVVRSADGTAFASEPTAKW